MSAAKACATPLSMLQKPVSRVPLASVVSVSSSTPLEIFVCKETGEGIEGQSVLPLFMLQNELSCVPLASIASVSPSTRLQFLVCGGSSQIGAKIEVETEDRWCGHGAEGRHAVASSTGVMLHVLRALKDILIDIVHIDQQSTAKLTTLPAAMPLAVAAASETLHRMLPATMPSAEHRSDGAGCSAARLPARIISAHPLRPRSEALAWRTDHRSKDGTTRADSICVRQ